jgi:aspartyl protease family protein
MLLATTPAAAQLWKWTDADGIVRYTNTPSIIPPVYRARTIDLGSPQARLPEAAAQPGEPGVMPFTDGGPIRATVRLNGVPLSLMLDTGADRTVIAPAAMTRAGLDFSAARNVEIVGVTGSATARELVLPVLEVAGTPVGPLSVVVHDPGVPDVDGLLGRDVLDRFTLTVDAAAGRAILRPR